MTFLIKTYGCAMNIYESQKIAEKLEELGGIKTDNLGETDILIINSCSVRQAAEDSVYGLGRDLKKLSTKPLVILTGCVTGAAKTTRRRYEVEYLKKKAPFIDYFLTFEELMQELPHIINTNVVETLPQRGPLCGHATSLRRGNDVGLVPISYGCNNFCSYCIVPYARGPERSRSYNDIRAEVESLVKNGVSEITLLGQNVNSWGLDFNGRTCESAPTEMVASVPNVGADPCVCPKTFAELLQEIHEIPGISKISFLTSNPWDFTEDLVEALKLPKIDRYLHLPVQSGDAQVLSRMNRHYTPENYLALVSKIKRAVPEITLGTDIIVGFPGETEEQFKNTLKLIKAVGFKNIFVAMYSPRKGTVAAETMADDVPRQVKKDRHQQVLSLVKSLGQKYEK